ncbi:uncharacterized protein LOC143841222 [Paroedura picta]|uniref:uncharacterized protein LOC143828807 n=3 Tax=Paroedura picta TaxID=143630 RepID=UPI004056788A
MPKPRKGSFWQRAEAEALLELVLQSKSVGRLMASTHCHTKGAYLVLASKLRERGYVRTWEQVRTKFKRLKLDFLNSLEQWGGIPQPSGRTVFHDQMVKIWEKAGKPPLDMRRHMATQSPSKLATAPEREEGEEEGPSTSGQAAAETVEARLRAMEARVTSLEAQVAELKGEIEQQRQQREAEELKKKEDEDLFRRKVRGSVGRLSRRVREMEGAGQGSSGT